MAEPNGLLRFNFIPHWSTRCPDDIALRCVDQDAICHHITWRQVEQGVHSLARQFIEQGISQGEVIVLVGKNHTSLVWAFLAAMQLGHPVSFIAPAPLERFLEKLDTLASSQQRIWGYGPERDSMAILEQALGHSVNLHLIKSINLPMNDSECHQTIPSIPTNTLAYHPDNLATLTFTSGSMGKPKAVAHTHRHHIASATGLLARFAFSFNDTWLLSLPLYHVSGLAIIYRWLVAGGCLQIGRGHLLTDISDVTHASLVPVQLQRLLEQDNPLSLTHVLLGGSYIPHDLAQKASERNVVTWIGYGMTEAASTVTAKPFDQCESAGFVLPKRNLKIDQQRIFVSGETLAQGYFYQGNIMPITDEQGWFDTKDIGCWQQDELVVLGRADNMFISGGENVHCEEIEAVLAAHPAIDAAIVIAVIDSEFGARPVAILRCATFFPKRVELDAWLADRLEKYKWPIDYFPMPELLLKQGIKLPRAILKTWLSEQGKYDIVMS